MENFLYSYFITNSNVFNNDIENVIKFFDIIIKYKIHYKLNNLIIINNDNINLLLENMDKIKLFYCNYNFIDINDEDKNKIYNYCLENNLFMDMRNLKDKDDMEQILYSNTIHPKYNYPKKYELSKVWDVYEENIDSYEFIKDCISSKHHINNYILYDIHYKKYKFPELVREKVLNLYIELIPYLKYFRSCFNYFNMEEKDVIDFLKMDIVYINYNNKNEKDMGLKFYKKILRGITIFCNSFILGNLRQLIEIKHVNYSCNLFFVYYKNCNYNPNLITEKIILKLINNTYFIVNYYDEYENSYDYYGKIIKCLLELDLTLDRWEYILSRIKVDKFIDKIYNHILKDNESFNNLTMNDIFFLTKHCPKFFNRLDINLRKRKEIYSHAYYSNVKNLRLIGIKNITQEMLDECKILHTDQESLNYIKTFEDKLNKNKK